jgi:electron transfer flavoprotein alpha subunit
VTDGWGFADMYQMDEDRSRGPEKLDDVTGDDWRNILVWGRATPTGVYPETLALVGRARYLADALGCRVEVLLVGEDLQAATDELRRYPIDRVYRVKGPDYAPIDAGAKIIEQVVLKRRPELVLVFQSRTGDAVTAFCANRLGVGFVVGALAIEIDTNERRAIVTHQATNQRFQMVTRMVHPPQFVSVQRGLFRAPMEDENARVEVHDLELDLPPLADIEVIERHPPAPSTLENADRVVVAGIRVKDNEELELTRQLAKRLGARFGVARSIVERGLAETDELVGQLERVIKPKLLVTVGVQGSLDFLEGIRGRPTICAIASHQDDPIAGRAAYLVPGTVKEAVQSVLDAL